MAKQSSRWPQHDSRTPACSSVDAAPYSGPRTPRYKRPKVVKLRGELPRTPVGKVLRRALREGGLPA